MDHNGEKETLIVVALFLNLFRQLVKLILKDVCYGLMQVRNGANLMLS